VHLRSHRTRQRCEIRCRQATPSVRRVRAGGFDVRGGWAGVRESVDRTSVVDGGCRGRDSRHRRPSKRERVTAHSVRPKIGRLPRGRALRSLRQAPRPAGPPPLFAPTTEKWNKTAIETVCSRGNCSATTFRDVAAHKRNETAPSGRRGAETAAAGRRKGGALNRQRHAPHLRFLLR
jgi:hypothetical protein